VTLSEKLRRLIELEDACALTNQQRWQLAMAADAILLPHNRVPVKVCPHCDEDISDNYQQATHTTPPGWVCEKCDRFIEEV